MFPSLAEGEEWALACRDTGAAARIVSCLTTYTAKGSGREDTGSWACGLARDLFRRVYLGEKTLAEL